MAWLGNYPRITWIMILSRLPMPGQLEETAKLIALSVDVNTWEPTGLVDD